MRALARGTRRTTEVSSRPRPCRAFSPRPGTPGRGGEVVANSLRRLSLSLGTARGPVKRPKRGGAGDAARLIIQHCPPGRSAVPELPEVETVVRELRPLLVGRRVVSARAGK